MNAKIDSLLSTGQRGSGGLQDGIKRGDDLAELEAPGGAASALGPALFNDTSVLHLITAGSVDDGKSTLIGRLLFDSKVVHADQLAAISRAKYRRQGDAADLALLTDGLEAEREQGITIDVAYRYFSTPRRKFIVADAPGHEQYTRNMVTGASSSDAIIILIDAARAADGVLLPQTRRHSTIAQLLGIRQVVVAVNKMDLVNWDREVFDRTGASYSALAVRLGIAEVHIVPISALRGDNVVTVSPHTPWYEGPTLLSLLEQLPAGVTLDAKPLRLPVQLVARHGGASADDFRGYMGQIASGVLRRGDDLVVQPAGVTARASRILVGGAEVEEARAGMPVTVVLDRDVDVSRGDVLALASDPVNSARRFEAELCWLDNEPLNPARKYLLKHATRLTTAKVEAVHSCRDMQLLQELPAETATLRMNDIGRVTVSVHAALVLDDYRELPATGAFVLIDSATHQTAAAGMVRAVR